MFLLLLIFLFTKADEHVLVGSNTKLQVIADTIQTCNSHDHSCYETICNMLGNNTRCLAYVALAPTQIKPLNCFFIPFAQVNMITFGIGNDHRDRQILYSKECYRIGYCLNYGCKMYNSRNDTMWIGFMGHCYYKGI
jgi:hypothetical protein